MKKPLAIMVIGILIFTGLTGCIDNGKEIEGLSNEEKKFVGTWKATNGLTYIFFSDGTGSYQDGTTTWEIKDSNLVIYWMGDEIVFTYTYIFSNNDKTLMLKSVESELEIVLTKR